MKIFLLKRSDIVASAVVSLSDSHLLVFCRCTEWNTIRKFEMLCEADLAIMPSRSELFSASLLVVS